MTHLVACPDCSRHVRALEHACPFCKTALSQALRETPAPMRPAAGLSRTALYVVGAALVAGCSPEPMTVVFYGSAPSAPPECVFPAGIAVGQACTGTTYVAALRATCVGYLVCYDDAWTYSEDRPVGWTPLDDGGVEAGDAGEADGDANTPSDAGRNDASDAGDAD